MATLEYWIQLENRPWDASPHDIDRMTGQTIEGSDRQGPRERHHHVAGTGVSKTRKMFNPLRDSDGKSRTR
jgi:hypothetical protein